MNPISCFVVAANAQGNLLKIIAGFQFHAHLCLYIFIPQVLKIPEVKTKKAKIKM